MTITSWTLWLHLDSALVVSTTQLLPNKPEVNGVNSDPNLGEYSHRRDLSSVLTVSSGTSSLVSVGGFLAVLFLR